VTLGGAWLLAPGCGGSTRSDGTEATPDCPAGSEGCPCRVGEECDDTLTCTSGECVEATEDAGQAQSEDAAQGTELRCPDLVDLAQSRFPQGLCGWEAQESEHLVTNLLLVGDGSASLAEEVPGMGATRWELLRGALADALGETPIDLEMGLLLVPDAEGLPPACDGAPAECCEVGAPDRLTTPIGPGEETLPEIMSALNAWSPAGASPLAAAFERAYHHLVEAGPGGARFVVLASDGGANCNQSLECGGAECTLELDPSESCLAASNTCCQASPGGCLDDAEVTVQIERLYDAGVQTLVVGVAGNEAYAAALGRWAEAGGTQRPDGGVGYYEVSIESELAAFVQAFQPVTHVDYYWCEIPLPREVPDFNEILVAVDCEPIPSEPEAEPGAESWWTFNNSYPELATAIILEGAVCERVRSAAVERVDVVFGCPLGGGY